MVRPGDGNLQIAKNHLDPFEAFHASAFSLIWKK
jgi:hypothetical protein